MSLLFKIGGLNKLFNEQARVVYFQTIIFTHETFEEANVGDLWQVKVLGCGASAACNANSSTPVNYM